MSTQTPLVTDVDFVTVFVKDFPAAKHFYGGVLGLPCSSEYRQVPGAEFDTGGVTLQVLDAASVGQQFKPSGHPIALHVADVAAARAQLESHGVAFAADTLDSGVCHMAFFQDPDGNALILHNRYAPRGA